MPVTCADYENNEKIEGRGLKIVTIMTILQTTSKGHKFSICPHPATHASAEAMHSVRVLI